MMQLELLMKMIYMKDVLEAYGIIVADEIVV